MTAHAAEFFTLDEVNRLKIIQDVVDRRLTTQMAAQRLGISDRQCRRLLSRYRESGPLGMANRRRGKPSNNLDNKRLGRTLEYIKLVQDKRDNNRSQAIPAGDGPSRRRRKPTDKKSQRSLNGDDMLEALKVLQSRSGEIFGSNTQKT